MTIDNKSTNADSGKLPPGASLILRLSGRSAWIDAHPCGCADAPAEGDTMVAGIESGSVANLADRSSWCTFAGNGFRGEHVMIEFKGSHFERDVILWAVRWYVAYPISCHVRFQEVWA